jgi:hypothetical protein
VTGRLGRDHHNVEIVARRHLAVVNIETVRECERCAFFDIRGDFFTVDLRDMLVGHQHHHKICAFDCVSDLLYVKTGFSRFLPGRAITAQAHGHFDAGIMQVERMRVALRSVAHDGNFLPLDK